jgi:hypothetical protein
MAAPLRILEGERPETGGGRGVKLTALREGAKQEVKALNIKLNRPAKPDETGKEK